MAFTVTSLYTAQALTSAAQTNTVYAKADLNAFAFNGLTLELKITNGSTPPLPGRPITVYYTFSSQDLNINTANIAETLRSSAYSVNVLTSDRITVVGAIARPVHATARYLYAWVNHDTLGQAVTLDASYIGYNFGTSA